MIKSSLDIIANFSMSLNIRCNIHCFEKLAPAVSHAESVAPTTQHTLSCVLSATEFIDLEEGTPVAVVLHDELKVTGSDQKCNVFLGHVNVAPLTSWEDMDGKVLAIFKVRGGGGDRRKEEGEGRGRRRGRAGGEGGEEEEEGRGWRRRRGGVRRKRRRGGGGGGAKKGDVLWHGKNV